MRANTVPAFALGDYEWILAFEAPELHRIVDLMRDLRATEARRHVREETPFFTGPRVSASSSWSTCPARRTFAASAQLVGHQLQRDRVDAVALIGRASDSPRR